MGYPVNTVGSDVFFQPSLDGKRAYFASFRDGGKGEHDIYIIELDEPEKDIAIVKGSGIITAEFADFHIGAEIRNLTRTPDFDIKITDPNF
jgi:hypothetical protein